MRPALGLYCLFIIYGSLIPFDFSFSADTLAGQLAKVHLLPFSGGRRVWSAPDLASNIALFIPFGLLLGGTVGAGLPPRRLLALVTGASLLFATGVEAAQLFLPSRTASPVDIACETLGGFGGGRLSVSWLKRGGVRPSLGDLPSFALACLAVALMVDRWYPFAATFDVSTALQSLRQARIVPFAGWSPDAGLNAFIPQLIWPALTGGLICHLIGRTGRDRPCPALLSAAIGTAFLAALEVGKLAFAGRSPQVDNVLLGGLGSLAGAALLPRLACSAVIRDHRGACLITLAGLLLTHSELTPYHFSVNSDQIAAKLASIEWLPFASYYIADPRSALFDLGNKLLLSGFFGFAVATEWPSSVLLPVLAGLASGTLLEAAQIFVATRLSSVTDVIIICSGTILGKLVYEHYAR